jgi:hypothetical protein
MGILDNLENAWDIYPEGQFENLSQKLFSDSVCSDCLCENESKPMPITDNMGREIFWEDLGRPTNA